MGMYDGVRESAEHTDGPVVKAYIPSYRSKPLRQESWRLPRGPWVTIIPKKPQAAAFDLDERHRALQRAERRLKPKKRSQHR